MKKNIHVINDPVYGFIPISNSFIEKLIRHPYIQRLSRIKQLGLASFAYPGAQHTRYHHTLGAMHLMQQVVSNLKQKDVLITEDETNGVLACILLHDVGHGPFSHVLEHTIVEQISHEEISLQLMQAINKEFNGELDLCISIFKNEYKKEFLHELVSGQLDVDRLDYLRRDCFFTGVREGNIGSERIIQVLNVHNNKLVVESKGVYSIENFLLSRRLMYWQVYHHKAAISAETILNHALKRAKEICKKGEYIFASPPLKYFLENDICKSNFNEKALSNFINLDDSDIWSALKEWSHSSDFILSTLSKHFINGDLFDIEVYYTPIDQEKIKTLINKYMKKYNISKSEAEYFISSKTVSTDVYNVRDNSIDILFNNNSIKNIKEVSEILNEEFLSKKSEKYYLSYLDI